MDFGQESPEIRWKNTRPLGRNRMPENSPLQEKADKESLLFYATLAQSPERC